MRPLSRRRLLHGFVGGLAAGAALHARPQPAFAQVGDDGRAAIATAAGAVLSSVAASLGVSAGDLQDSLFADLPGERLAAEPALTR